MLEEETQPPGRYVNEGGVQGKTQTWKLEVLGPKADFGTL